VNRWRTLHRITAVTLVAVAALAGAPAAVSAPVPGRSAAGLAAASIPGPTGQRPTDAPQGKAAQVEVQGVSPVVLSPAGAVAVRAVVRSVGTEPLARPLVRVKVRGTRLASREQVRDWVDGRRSAGEVVAEQVLPSPLAPGDAVTVSLRADAATVGLPADPSSWGPRGVQVEVGDLDGGFSPVARDRSFLVWYPDPETRPVRVSVLVPLSAGAPDVPSGVVPADRLATLTGEGGRLDRVLTAADRDGVAWVLDPALVASLAEAGDGTADDGSDTDGTGDDGTGDDGTTGTPSPAPTGSPASPATPGDGPAAAPTAAPGAAGDRSFEARLRSGAAGREVLALPYADPEVSAVAAAGQDELYRLAESLGRSTVERLLDEPARTDVAWPASGSVSRGGLALAVAAGRDAVVLSAGVQPPRADVEGTPLGRGRALVDGRVVDTLLADTALSQALAAPTTTTPARLLAETAALVLEEPGDASAQEPPRHVLVAAPRGWDPPGGTGRAVLSALLDAPWTEPAPLEQLEEREPAVERVDPDYPPADAAAELDPAGIRRAAAALEQARATSAVLTDAAAVLDVVEVGAVSATSVAWRDDPAAWAEALSSLEARARGVLDGLSVLAGSTVNLLSAEAGLPVTVVNDLDQPVRVQVALRPRSARLVAEGPVAVELPAGGRQRVAVPVRGVASGDTAVEVRLLAPDGTPVGAATTLQVRVRADWESNGTLAVAVVALVVLVVGLVRTVRRGRRRDPASAGPLAGGPAPQREEGR
jgi:hypothetical protein